MATARLAVARAQIHLWQFPAGYEQVVNLDSDYVKMCVEAGHIIILRLLPEAETEEGG